MAARARRRGLRVEVDPGKERLNKQIRNAEQQRVPLMCVVGEAEVATDELSVRARGRGDLGAVGVDALFGLLDGLDDVVDLDASGFVVKPKEEAA